MLLSGTYSPWFQFLPWITHNFKGVYDNTEIFNKLFEIVINEKILFAIIFLALAK